MIDIHCHILPALDDGARDLSMSMDMARTYLDNGFKKIIATPHYVRGQDNFSPEQVEIEVDKLNKVLEKEGLDLKVYPGNEVYSSPAIIEDLLSVKFSSLNNSRYILIELPMHENPSYMKDIIYELDIRGYTTIIAHPERNSEIIEDPNILYDYVKQGALAQLNIHALTGLYGSDIKKVAEIMLAHKLYHFVATDAHSNKRRSPSCQEDILILKSLVDEEYYQSLTRDNGQMVLEDKKIEIDRPKEILKKRGFFRSLFKAV